MSQDLISTEGVGFEPTVPFGTLVFKTRAINHSTTPPGGSMGTHWDYPIKVVQCPWLTALGGFDVRAGGTVELGGDPLAAFAIDRFGIIWVARRLSFCNLGSKSSAGFFEAHRFDILATAQ